MELEIGLIVATLPVMVLAVGIGVNDAVFICNRLQSPPVQGAKAADALKARARASRP
jgi:predicted RND superfamily exporter protein